MMWNLTFPYEKREHLLFPGTRKKEDTHLARDIENSFFKILKIILEVLNYEIWEQLKSSNRAEHD